MCKRLKNKNVMEQYIKKSTLVEEIEGIKNTEYNGNSISDDVACCALDMTIDAIVAGAVIRACTIAGGFWRRGRVRLDCVAWLVE